MQQMYGSNIRLWVSYIPVICVSDPDDLQVSRAKYKDESIISLYSKEWIQMLQMLLSKNLEKHEHYRFLHDILGDGLISIEGKFVWLTHII